MIELIDFSGGLISTTYTDRVQINRIIPFYDRQVSGMDRTIIDVNLTELSKSNMNFELFDSDSITFFPISDISSNIVIVEGEVQRPGSYELKRNMKISELISLAGGLTGQSYREYASITRYNSDLSLSHLNIHLDSAMSNFENHNISLMSNDELLVLNYNDMRYNRIDMIRHNMIILKIRYDNNDRICHNIPLVMISTSQ